MKGFVIPFGIYFATECFAKIVKTYKYFCKCSILDHRQGSGYANLSISTN